MATPHEHTPETRTQNPPAEATDHPLPAALTADIAAIEAFCRALMRPGEVHELRVPARASGYYNDPASAAVVAALLGDGDEHHEPAKAVYLTLNPVDPGLPEILGLTINGSPRTVNAATGDRRILRRRNLLIDVDPVRSAEVKPDDSATDDERDAALAVRDRIRDFLSDHGWPEPVVASMSGNGGGLIYHIDLPNDAASTRLVEVFLGELAKRFNTESVTVDTKTGNASRITKVVGTVARKGPGAPERPWRLATGECRPEAAAVSRGQLEDFAALGSGRASGESAPASSAIRERLRNLGVGWTEQEHDYGTVLDLDRCLTSELHADGAYITEFPDGGLDYGCHHNSCAGMDWSDVRALLGYGPVIESGGGKESQATKLVKLAEGIDLFHTPDHAGYATLTVRDHRETMALRSKNFKRYLSLLFFRSEGKTAGAQAVTDALALLEGRAVFDAPERPVHTRIAGHGGRIYLDLGNDKWESVEIDGDGWRVVAEPPVRFRRPSGLLPLPRPEAGGSVEELRTFVNVASDDDWRLLLGWLLHTLRPTGPYAVLGLHGEQGSAKSTTSKVLRSLVDPNVAPVRAEPRELRDFMIAANNSLFVAFDNLSYLQPWQSDALCRLATGGGFATRELYTDAEEVIFETMRPVLLNGIGEAATRSDLIDRSVLLDLPNVPEEARRDEETFWAEFERVRPHVLGALLDATATAIRALPATRLERKPRMADFALWVTAAESALGWEPGGFLRAYEANRQEGHERALEAEPIVPLIRQLFELRVILGRTFTDPHLSEDRQEWRGTSTELLHRLEELGGVEVTRKRAWPRNAQALSSRLRRIAPDLRADGIDVSDYRLARRRELVLRRLEDQPPNADSDAHDVHDAPAPGSSSAAPASSDNGRHDADDADDADDAFVPAAPPEREAHGQETTMPIHPGWRRAQS